MSVSREPVLIKRNRALCAIAGLIWLILAGGFTAAVIITARRTQIEFTSFVVLCVADAFFTLVMVICAVLNFLNLRRPYAIKLDNDGIWHYAGLCHFNLVRWEEIADIEYASLLSRLIENEARVRIVLKNASAFKSRLPFLKRFAMLGRDTLSVSTFGTNVKPRELAAVLQDRTAYYGGNLKKQQGNGN